MITNAHGSNLAFQRGFEKRFGIEIEIPASLTLLVSHRLQTVLAVERIPRQLEHRLELRSMRLIQEETTHTKHVSIINQCMQ